MICNKHGLYDCMLCWPDGAPDPECVLTGQVSVAVWNDLFGERDEIGEKT